MEQAEQTEAQQRQKLCSKAILMEDSV